MPERSREPASKVLILRFVTMKQKTDSIALAEYFKMSEKSAAMRLLRYHRQGLLQRKRVSPQGRRLYVITSKGRERMKYLASKHMVTT
jgi:predicted transcriptional regulator